MLELNKENFESEVLEAEGYVLVDFWSQGCEQKVLGLPTIAIYKDGNKVEEVTKDDATVPNIEAMINKYL